MKLCIYLVIISIWQIIKGVMIMQKIKVNKQTYHALKTALDQEKQNKENVLRRHASSNFRGELNVLNQLTMLQLSEALIIGFESEDSIEEKSRKLFALCDSEDIDMEQKIAYLRGLKDAFFLQGIEYPWIDEMLDELKLIKTVDEVIDHR